jgi:cobalamin biosynthesis Mg chelatase CobN
VLLASVLALCASLSFPLLAQADSAGSQYEDAVIGPCGYSECTKKKHEPTANPSNTNGGGGGGTSPTEGGGSAGDQGSSGEGGSSTDSAGGVAATGNDGGTGQGSSQNDGGQAQNQPQGGAQSTPGELSSGTTAQTADDDGSSPLVPILIAVAILAALSVGAVVMRQRRQRNDGAPSVSAKAG